MSDIADASKEKAFDPDFVWSLGAFFAQWATLELVTSYGICKFLKISFEEAHILTSGMEFGRKSTLLRNLVYRSDAPEKGQILSLLGKIQNESKRNVFAHSFIISGPETVTFIDRTRSGDYAVSKHTFTVREFFDHVMSFTRHSAALEKCLGLNKGELQRFAMAALSANTKSTKLPDPPSESA
jgi:hypothetical protein